MNELPNAETRLHDYMPPDQGYGRNHAYDARYELERQSKTRRVRLASRFFAKRRFDLSFQQGIVVEYRFGGFGIGNEDEAWFIRSRSHQRPPLDTEVIIATGSISHSFGRARRRKRPVLLGFASEDVGMRYCRGNWSMLTGHPLLGWLICLPVMLFLWYYGGQAFLDNLTTFTVVAFFFWAMFNLYYLAYFPVKLWQQSSLRYQLKAHTSQLHRWLER